MGEYYIEMPDKKSVWDIIEETEPPTYRCPECGSDKLSYHPIKEEDVHWTDWVQEWWCRNCGWSREFDKNEKEYADDFFRERADIR